MIAPFDLDRALAMHTEWKLWLLAYLDKPDGSLDAVHVMRDDACPLGEWLFGEGRKFAHLDEYATLVDAHVRFHKEAATIVRLINDGIPVATDRLLDPGSPYVQASRAVTEAILAFRKKAAA
jgi:methyl-accepting chemotaxis protein